MSHPVARELRYAAVYVAVQAALAFGTTQLESYPVSTALLVGAVIVPNVALGFLVGRLRWCALAAVLIVLLPLAASSESGPAAFFALITASVVAVGGALLIGVGVALSLAVDRDGPRWRVASHTVIAVLLIAIVPVCLITPVLERNRTIRLSAARPVAIDLALGRYRGVGLDSNPATVEATLGGRGQPERDNGSEPLDAGSLPYSGPNSLSGGDHDRSERYRGVSLHLAGGQRVDYLEITDRRVRTAAGIGPGDSLSLARRAYPALHCAEGLGGEEPPIPYPFCAGRLGPRCYVYLASTYRAPGIPITAIWLSTTRLA